MYAYTVSQLELLSKINWYLLVVEKVCLEMCTIPFFFTSHFFYDYIVTNRGRTVLGGIVLIPIRQIQTRSLSPLKSNLVLGRKSTVLSLLGSFELVLFFNLSDCCANLLICVAKQWLINLPFADGKRNNKMEMATLRMKSDFISHEGPQSDNNELITRLFPRVKRLHRRTKIN